MLITFFHNKKLNHQTIFSKERTNQQPLPYFALVRLGINAP